MGISSKLFNFSGPLLSLCATEWWGHLRWIDIYWFVLLEAGKYQMAYNDGLLAESLYGVWQRGNSHSLEEYRDREPTSANSFSCGLYPFWKALPSWHTFQHWHIWDSAANTYVLEVTRTFKSEPWVSHAHNNADGHNASFQNQSLKLLLLDFANLRGGDERDAETKEPTSIFPAIPAIKRNKNN